MDGLTVLLRIIEVVAPLLVALVSVYLSNRLVAYRIDQLEKNFDGLTKKVESHNQFNERVALLEQDNNAQWKRIDELKAEVHRV